MPEAEIIIVGGGPAGLSTAGALKQIGLESTILDSSERIGQSWEQRYDRLRLHTVRAYSGLAHYPIPRTYPKYLTKNQYAEYLRSYAAHFGLNFVPRSPVRCIRQGPVNGKPGWQVDTDAETWSARVVVIATGQYGQPVRPDWPGLNTFAGKILHSSAYRTGRDFAGQKVLVIGAGNSGMEIAADLVEQGAAQVTISIRSAPLVAPRDLLGTPAQVFGILMNTLPPPVSDRVAYTLSRLALGDLRRYGLPSPDWLPFSACRTPVFDVGFVAALKAGRISVRPAVHSFTPTGVIYADQRAEPFDAVVLATGFRPGLESLLEPAGLLDEAGSPRFPSGAPTTCPGLYFMGFFNTVRGFLYDSNRMSQRLAKEIKSGYQ